MRESSRKVPRPCAWEQERKWRDSSTSLQKEHSADVASLNFCNRSEFVSRSLHSKYKVDLWFGVKPLTLRLLCSVANCGLAKFPPLVMGGGRLCRKPGP